MAVAKSKTDRRGTSPVASDEDEVPTFDPFLADPLVLGRLVGERPRPGRAARLAFPIVIVGGLLLLVGINLFQGTFFSDWSTTIADVRAILSQEPSEVQDPTFPLLRDLPTILVALVAFATPGIVARQWVIMRSYVRDLYLGGLLFDKSVKRQDYEHMVAEQNERLMRSGRNAGLRVLFAVLFAIFVTVVQEGTGMFAPLGESDDFAKEAYEGWWASLSTQPLGFVAYILLASSFFYIVLTQNVVGIRLVQFMHSERRKLFVGFDLRNTDGVYGWSPMRSLLWSVYFSLAAHLAAILAYMFALSPQAFASWLLFLTILYLLAVPTYVFVPIRIFRQHRREAIASRIDELFSEREMLVERSRSASSSVDQLAAATRALIADEDIKLVRGVPLSPFNQRDIVVGAMLYLLPIVASLVQIFGVWYTATNGG